MTLLYLSPVTISTSSSTILLQGMRPMRKLMSMAVPNDKHKYHQIKASNLKVPLNNDEEMKGSTIQEGSMALKRTSSHGYNSDELVYHVDYHGVTTHPTPTPRHPKP
ncbi:Solute carrier family 13 member 3 [Fagus crenata]